MASGYVSKKIVDDILQTARKANSLLGISGLLLYRMGHFVQLLEGDEEAVLKLYQKIQLDSRHKECKVLAQFVAQ